MCAPDAPDTTGQQAAALQQANLSAEQLAWAKQIYAESAPDRAAAITRANTVSDAQLEALTKQTAITDEYAAYNKGTFQPLEKQIVQEAVNYDTPERRAAESGNAMAQVGTQFDVARGTAAREASARGVDPSSGSFAAQMGVMGATQAAQQAGAGNAAAKQVETIGAAKKLDAASLGRGLAANQATSAGIALNQGNSAVSNAQVPGAVTTQGAALLNSGYSGAQAGLANAATTYGSIANANSKSGDSSGLFSALGQVGGAFAGSAAGSAMLVGLSDKNLKEDIEPADTEKALDEVIDTPVKNWAYRSGTVADDGGAPHIGPMAQDVEKTMGGASAPDGTKIDLINLNGKTMAAIQGLAKREEKNAAALATLTKKVNKVMATQGVGA